MAGELPLVKLIELGFELCGSYSISPAGEYSPGVESADKTLYGHPPLTSTKAIKSLITRLEGVNGQKKADRALRYIADGSASPMETIIIMLLTLPHKLGGYGLPMPELNRRIDSENAAKWGSRRYYYICDLFWPKANIAIEYDSDFYHAGADRMDSDSTKRLDLTTHDINVLTVTNRKLRNPAIIESIAKLIAKRLGIRLRYENPQFLEARRELRNLLL